MMPAASGKIINTAKPSTNQSWKRRRRCSYRDTAFTWRACLVFTRRLRVFGLVATAVEPTVCLHRLQAFCSLAMCVG